MRKTLYLLRHGETELNRKGVVQGSGVDAGLNGTGQRQAAAFYRHYRHTPFEVVLTSALRRTHQTMAPFLSAGLPWEQWADLNEICWGEHEGKESTPGMVEEYRTLVNRWQAGDFRASLRAGETAEHMQARLLRFVERVKARPERTLLICSHGRAMRCLICLLRGEPVSQMERYQHANTGLWKIAFQGERFDFELENDTRHLSIL